MRIIVFLLIASLSMVMLVMVLLLYIVVNSANHALAGRAVEVSLTVGSVIEAVERIDMRVHEFSLSFLFDFLNFFILGFLDGGIIVCLLIWLLGIMMLVMVLFLAVKFL